MRKLISWVAIVPLGMATISVFYCCEILASFHGRPAVPMTTSTHIMYMTWTITALLGGGVLSLTMDSKFGKSVSLIGSLLAGGTLAVWLTLIYLGMLLPYDEVYQI